MSARLSRSHTVHQHRHASAAEPSSLRPRRPASTTTSVQGLRTCWRQRGPALIRYSLAWVVPVISWLLVATSQHPARACAFVAGLGRVCRAPVPCHGRQTARLACRSCRCAQRLAQRAPAQRQGQSLRHALRQQYAPPAPQAEARQGAGQHGGRGGSGAGCPSARRRSLHRPRRGTRPSASGRPRAAAPGSRSPAGPSACTP